ncbi:MAG: hypothetical protein OXG35_29105 [Acidobacteria bacterium]|nr:hypothetical protein [Acidobacteriota bacterium]
MYLAYALFCEGASDYSYFEVLLPRVIESTVLRAGRVTVDVPERPALRLGKKGRAVDEVAAEACDRRERQSMDALGRSKSFQEFEVGLQRALLDLGVLERTAR